MKKIITIGNHIISEKTPVFIIAEIGANHNNDFELAKRMIDISVEAGADAVKFQSYKAETLYSKYTPPKDLGNGKKGPNPFELIKSVQMSYEWHKPLKEYCDGKGIIFLSSPFDFEAVDSLEECNVPAYKIASSEIGDPLLLKYISEKQKPMIVSTGKSTMDEIKRTVRWINEAGNDQVVLLHCTASYPASYAEMNLKVIQTLAEMFDCIVGFSDHNEENITAVSAVSLGAKIIEKHITMDKSMKGPDHSFALEPCCLFELVEWVRKAEAALGSNDKTVQQSEQDGRQRGNRSIHAKRNIQKGEILSLENMIIKRPAFGIKGFELEKMIGRKAAENIKEDMWITWDNLEK